MKKLEELSYYTWLEDVIRERRGKNLNFPYSTAGERDAEIRLLVEYIEKKYPKMYEKLLAGTVDATSNNNITQNDILGFLGKSEKGTCVTWKDMNGNEFLFVNAGIGGGKNKRRILIMGNDDSKRDVEIIKKSIVSELLRKDIEHVYNKIQQKELKHKQSKTYLSELFSQKDPIVHTAGSFEDNFKKLIRKQGFGASPMNTAQVMVRTMSGSEKKKLFNSLNAIGVKSGEDLENLLSKWRDEALHEKPKQVRNITMARNNDIGIGL